MNILTVTTSNNDGVGSLRQAITLANDGDTIKFSAKLSNQEIRLTSGQLHIEAKKINIDGAQAPGLKISGNHLSRAFLIAGGSTVEISNLEITNGKTKDQGGGIYVRRGSLTLKNSVIKNNIGGVGGGVYLGGGTLNIVNSKFINNDGTASKTMKGFSGGAISIRDAGKLTIQDSIFENNVGHNGGAIYGLGSSMTIDRTSFLGNRAIQVSGGGAIFTDGAHSGAHLDKSKGGVIKITQSLFQDNYAEGFAGALFLYGYNQDKAIIENSNFLNNSASPSPKGAGKGGALVSNMGLDIKNTSFIGNIAEGQGGALWLDSKKRPVKILNSTFAQNQANRDAGGAMFLNTGANRVDLINTTIVNNHARRANGALWMAKNHNVNVKNSIVAFNTADVVALDQQVGYLPIDRGGNLEVRVSGAKRVFLKGMNTNPQLDQLQKRGGVWVYPLLEDSPAINSGVQKGAPTQDQIGQTRDLLTDIGAVEYLPATTSPSENLVIKISGSSQNDVLKGNARGNILIGKSGDDKLSGGGGHDKLFGGEGNDKLSGGGGHDKLFGGEGNDVLRGNSGNDVLYGNGGDDLLLGSKGNDLLIGNNGFDTLTGGNGSDRFRWTQRNHLGDVITDFEVGVDIMEISRKVLAPNLDKGLVSLDEFSNRGSAQSTQTRFIFDASSNQLFFDADGIGNQGQILIASFQNSPNLSSGSIQII